MTIEPAQLARLAYANGVPWVIHFQRAWFGFQNEIFLLGGMQHSSCCQSVSGGDDDDGYQWADVEQ
jgi:hypothetical protein